MVNLFPLGVTQYLVGGLLVGLGVALIFVMTGIYAGASSFFSSTWSWFSRARYFHQAVYTNARVWRLVFTAGLIGGALVFTFFSGSWFVTEVQWWRLLLGGFLVGVGTRMSRGCTSGHGICGLASWSFPSLVAVIVFMGIAIATAFAISSLGVLP